LIDVGALSLFLAATVLAPAQSFGRFGYAAVLDVPGLQVDAKGFRSRHSAADAFRFEEPSALWRPVLTSDSGQTVMLSGVGRAPTKVRADLFGAGISLYFRHGIGFRLGSTSAPYLTWHEGSVGPNVPTPAVKWILISFRDAQPPVLLASLAGPAAFRMTGRPGDWRLRSEAPFEGWIRVTNPTGIEGVATNSASALGSLKARVTPLLPYLTGPVPKPTGVTVAEDAQGVVAEWTFDRPYAALPTPMILAPLGGYPLKLESKAIRLDSSDPSGPTSVLAGAELRVRFPVRRVPTGRAVVLAEESLELPGTVSHLDAAGIGELALANFLALRDDLTREAAESAVHRYLGDAVYREEPFTGQKLPYEPDGQGLDLAAAHALLMQSTISTVKATSEPNSLLTSVLWRRDRRSRRRSAPSPAAGSTRGCSRRVWLPKRGCASGWLERASSPSRSRRLPLRSFGAASLAMRAPKAPFSSACSARCACMRKGLFAHSRETGA
jgi:hypothetical protein